MQIKPFGQELSMYLFSTGCYYYHGGKYNQERKETTLVYIMGKVGVR